MSRYVLTLRAELDLLEIWDYIAQDSPLNAQRFVTRLVRAIDSLVVMPRRHPMALEARKVKGDIRHVIVDSYRIVFEVSGNEVRVHDHLHRDSELRRVIGEIAHAVLFVILDHDRERAVGARRRAGRLGEPAGGRAQHRARGKNERRETEAARGLHDLAGDLVVDPDFAALVVRGDDVGRAQHGGDIGGAHALANFLLHGAEREAIRRTGVDRALMIRGRHAAGEQKENGRETEREENGWGHDVFPGRGWIEVHGKLELQCRRKRRGLRRAKRRLTDNAEIHRGMDRGYSPFFSSAFIPARLCRNRRGFRAARGVEPLMSFIH